MSEQHSVTIKRRQRQFCVSFSWFCSCGDEDHNFPTRKWARDEWRMRHVRRYHRDEFREKGEGA